MSEFTDMLVVSPLGDGKFWRLRNSFSYHIGEEGSSNRVTVPEGFCTDFASVPRPLWWLFPTWGRYGNAAVIHDFCYWEQSRDRKEADLIFLEGMVVLHVRRFTRMSLYFAVRGFGWLAWWRNGRKKRARMMDMAMQEAKR